MTVFDIKLSIQQDRELNSQEELFYIEEDLHSRQL